MSWLFKHFLVKVILAAFFIVFGVSVVKFLAHIVVFLCAVMVLMVVIGIWWVCSKIKEIFS